jgi:polyphosphate kinase
VTVDSTVRHSSDANESMRLELLPGDEYVRPILAALACLRSWRLHRDFVPKGEEKPPVIVLLEGRDGSGKTTTARDVVAALGPHMCRVISIARPNVAERRGFFFERWLAHLPRSGSVAVFDRSWYNRALVERVMGFCSARELDEFFAAAPRVEAELVSSGYVIVKLFFTISKEEQLRRLEERRVRGSLSAVDAVAFSQRDAYARAEAEMFERTSTAAAPWIVLPECDRQTRRAAVLDRVSAAWSPRRSAASCRSEFP